MDVKIDKGIKLPERHPNGGAPGKYPWDEMKVGDSFLFPKSVSDNAARANASNAGGRSGNKKFVVRKTEDGYRCWRVS